jgi:hypothetical protein
MKHLEKYLEFNKSKVYFVSVNGVWWVAIKPICDALGVDYEGQRKNLQEDKILGQLPSIQTVVGADGRLRKMVCVPEFFVYGWIFSIQSKSDQLTDYKLKCYEILYNHFHGSMTESLNNLREKSAAEKEMEDIDKQLSELPLFKRRMELQSIARNKGKAAQRAVKNYFSSQMDLFKTETSN